MVSIVPSEINKKEYLHAKNKVHDIKQRNVKCDRDKKGNIYLLLIVDISLWSINNIYIYITRSISDLIELGIT